MPKRIKFRKQHRGRRKGLATRGNEISFGEYLVEQGVLDRYQLFRALQMQDRVPGVRLGEAAAALGYAPIGAIERFYQRFSQLGTIEI